MMQGDACLLGIRILNNAGVPVTPTDVIEGKPLYGSRIGESISKEVL